MGTNQQVGIESMGAHFSYNTLDYAAIVQEVSGLLVLFSMSIHYSGRRLLSCMHARAPNLIIYSKGM